MDVKDTVKELFEPTFEAIGDSDLGYDPHRQGETLLQRAAHEPLQLAQGDGSGLGHGNQIF